MSATTANRGHSPAPATGGAAPSATLRWVVFTLDNERFALPLAVTERVVRAAQVTPLPAAPPVVLGAINIAGSVLPVFDLRRRFGRPERPILPSDHFLIARTERRAVVLAIDMSLGVVERPAQDLIDAEAIGADVPHVSGVLPLEDGLVLIHDLERFLSPEEGRALDRALAAEADGAG